MEKNKNLRWIMAAMMAALVCAATMVVRIPSPVNGYINLGDGAVLLAAWLLGPLGGAAAGGCQEQATGLWSVDTTGRSTVPGLYAAGDCLGGRYGIYYYTPCGGNFIGTSMTLGRELGKHLASL